MECIRSAGTGFGSHPDHKRSRPPSSTVLDVLSTVSARAGNRSVRVSWYARFTRVRSNNLSTQLRRTRTSSTVSPSGLQTIDKFGANTSGDDCTPHRAGKYTKSSGSAGLSTANTSIPYGLAISSCGLTSISAIAATAFSLIRAANCPNSAISLKPSCDKVTITPQGKSQLTITTRQSVLITLSTHRI